MAGQGRKKGSKNEQKPPKAFAVTQIDFAGNPVQNFMLFTDNLKVGKLIKGNDELNDKGFVEIVKKSGLENVVINNYTNSLKKKPSQVASLESICAKCFALDYDAFREGRYYLTFTPQSSYTDEDCSLVGTGKDLYWVIDDIKKMREVGNGKYIGVVS